MSSMLQLQGTVWKTNIFIVILYFHVEHVMYEMYLHVHTVESFQFTSLLVILN